jgi:phage shock protein PspC (stress-responsive transcriptional regulator)
MQKVVIINLNGNAYQLDEPAYESLRAYLDGAAAALAANPDKDEVLADIEQAIAEKCNRYLGPHKTVVLEAEILRIVEEMGPVEGPAPAGTEREAEEKAKPGPETPKRLYQIREGSMISGVCNGIAAYFNLDVTIVRIAFVLLAFLTSGLWVLVYVVMMFVIPYATTSEERAAARGMPFNAQELIEQAKKNYAAFKDSQHWKWQWKQQRRQWRYQQRMWRRQWRQTVDQWHGWDAGGRAPAAGYATQILAGILAPIFVVLSVALFSIWAAALISLLMTGTVFHWALPADTPLWAGILILFLAYHVVAWPLHAARRASYHAMGYGYGRHVATEGLITLGFGVLFFWLAYHYVPEVHDFVTNFPHVWPSIWENVRQSLK